MSLPIAIAIHVILAAIWVGGMFFAYVCLRPVAASLLDPPLRLPLWTQTFKRFFIFVWTAVLILPLSGVWLAQSLYGTMAQWPVHVHAMAGLGLVMIMIFAHVFFAPYARLRQAVSAQDWQAGSVQLATIRRLVGVNTIIGLVVVLAASAGRLW